MNALRASRLNRWADAAISKIVNIPYEGVAHDPAHHLSHNSKSAIIKKYLYKYLSLKLRGQNPLERNKVPNDVKTLWLYLGKRNFGDANMDISGRALIKDKGYDIDLFTLPNLHGLFGQDDIFRHVYSNLEEIKNNKYDFILLTEFNLPTIRFKVKHFKKVPFAGLFRFFLGPPRNQTRFSYAAVNSVFDLKHTPIELDNLAKPYLHAHPEVSQSVAHLIPEEPFLAISIGGQDDDRSYRHWPEFLHLLDQSNSGEIPKTVVLLGSENGLEMNGRIAQENFVNLNIHSFVGQLSLLQAREIISKSRTFIGCDGGLMHVAHSTQTPSVSLFRAFETDHMYLTKSCHSIPIQSSGEVSAIEPAQILSQLRVSLLK